MASKEAGRPGSRRIYLFKPYRDGLKSLVEGTTIQMLAAEIQQGRSRLINIMG